MTVNLQSNAASGGDAQGDTISGFDNLTGGNGGDRLTGNAGSNSLTGGLGGDTLNGGTGLDTADYSQGGGVSINLTTGSFLLAAAGDRLTGIERLIGSAVGDDFLIGGSERDLLEGLGGNDRMDGLQGADALTGGGGRDRLTGRAGGDTLLGGGGADRLNGGSGNDRMTGGGDGDKFIYDLASFGADSISDFTDNADKIWFKRAIANAFADLSIAGNGTADVTIAVIGQPGQSISLHGPTALVLTASDFVFFG